MLKLSNRLKHKTLKYLNSIVADCILNAPWQAGENTVDALLIVFL